MIRKFSSAVLALVMGVSALAGCSGKTVEKPTTPAKPATSAKPADTKPADTKSNYQGQTLNVTVYGGGWGDAFKDGVITKFEKETGAKVEIILGSDAEYWTKLRAGGGKNPPFDVVILNPDQVPAAAAAKLIVPLQTDKMKHWKDVDPYAYRLFQQGNDVWAVSFSFGQLGLAYRSDKVKTPPTSWLDMFDPQYKGKVALPTLTYSAGLQYFVALTRTLGGHEKNTKDIEKTFTKLAELKGSAFQFPNNSGAVQTLLEQGEVWIAPLWDGRIFAMQQAGAPLGFVYPKEGPVGSGSQFSITAGSKNTELANLFVDYAMDPVNQKPFAEKMWYGTSNTKVDYSPAFRAKVSVGPGAYEKLIWVDYDVATEKLNAWQTEWNRLFSK